MEKDDVELIDDILSGDEAAFSSLVRKYQKGIHALAWRKIGDFHIAEEITQDIFLHVYKKLPTLKNPNQFSGWLYVIADRQCIAWLRKKKPTIQSLEVTRRETLEEAAYAYYISEQHEEMEVERRREIVQSLLEKLPESERTVVILHYLGEMTCEAISKFLGVSPNTVKSRLSRARKRLREEESLIRETLGSVPLSTNLTENIMRDIANVEQTSPSGGKPLLPLGALGSSLVLVILLIGASNQLLTHFQLSYSFDAQSETTIEIVEMPVIPNIKSKPDVKNRVGSDTAPRESSNDGSAKGETSMQNNLIQDSTQWKLPEGAKARLGKGHIFDMTYSPDGTLLAAAGTIGIWIYDARTGKELNLLIEHMDSVSTVAFSPNNQLLASDGRDSTILLWDPHTGKRKATLTGHQEGVNSVAFSPDGKSLVSGGNDETIRLWDVSTGEQLLTFAGHAGGVSEVMYSPDGEMLVSHGMDEMIHLWDAHTGEFLRSITEYKGDVYSIAYSPDGQTLASAGDDGKIRLWEPFTGQLKTTIEATTELHGVNSISFNPDGKSLISNTYEDDMIQFWDIASGERLKTIKSPPDTTHHIVLSPDGNTLVNAGSDGTIRFWNVENATPIRTLNGYAEMFSDMAFSPDGNKVVAVSSGPSLRIWDTRTGNLIKTYFPDSVRIKSIAYAPDGVTLACAGGPDSHDTFWLLNTESGEKSIIFSGHTDTVEAVAFSPDGKTIASGGWDETIRLWDADTGETKKIMTGEKDIIRDIKYSPDGKMLVSMSDSAVRFWDVASGETIKNLSADTITLSPDWKKFVCVSMAKSGFMQFWNMDDNEPIKSITPEEKTYYPTYSPDGSTIVVIGPGHNISFWDADTYEVIHTIPDGHKKSSRSEGVWFLRYSPDGRTLATAGWDSTILLWDVPE